jgi:hypothetical protein
VFDDDDAFDEELCCGCFTELQFVQEAAAVSDPPSITSFIDPSGVIHDLREDRWYREMFLENLVDMSERNGDA